MINECEKFDKYSYEDMVASMLKLQKEAIKKMEQLICV